MKINGNIREIVNVYQKLKDLGISKDKAKEYVKEAYSCIKGY